MGNYSISASIKKLSWAAIGAFTVLIAASAIVTTNWLYLGALLCIPLLIYIYFKINPFVCLFGLYAFLLPMDSFLLLWGSFAGQGLTKYLAILIIVVLFLKGTFEKNFKRPDTTVIWLILLSLYSLLTLTWAIERPGLYIIRNVVSLPIFYLIISSYKVHKKDFEILKWCIIGGGFVTALLSVYSYETLLQSGETIDRVSIVIGDQISSFQNAVAFGLLIPASMSLEKILQQKERLRKLLLVIVLGSILFSIILTGSRGGMLGAGVIFAVYFLLSRKKVTFLALVIPLVILIISLAPSFLFERWGTAVETGGAGRTVIWHVGLKALVEKYWLAGAGLYNFPAAYNEFADYATRYVELNRGAHNIYLMMFVELGIIGFTLMLIVFIRHYKAIQSPFKSGKYDFDSIMLKASFWSILASSFFLDTFWDKPFWLLWMLIMIRKNALGYEGLHEFYLHRV